MRSRLGMTLIEVLIALTLFSAVIGGGLAFLTSQQRIFLAGVDELSVGQNLEYGLTSLALEVRAAGAGVPVGQPSLVYAGPTTFSFNADLSTNIANDPFATYYDPDAPAGSVSALRLANQITIPGSSRTYPIVDYFGPDGLPSPAETITYWFELDPETGRADDYRLHRRVNNANPELVARSLLLPAGESAFFTYRYLLVPFEGTRSLATTPSFWGALTFAGATKRIDSLRAVTVSYRVTNGRTGAAERTRAVSLGIGMPNLGERVLQPCGDIPAFAGPVEAVYDVDQGGVKLSFPSSTDELGGERDILRYAVYRKVTGATHWGDPILSISAGVTTYVYLDRDVLSGISYTYGVAAQDCSPRLSALLSSPSVDVP